MALTIHSSTPAMPAIARRHLRHTSLQVADATQIAEARRGVAERTHALRFSSITAGEAAIVVTEMAGNLVKHGDGGELLLRTIGTDEHPGIELLALDRGRGMDVDRCLVDGYSTASSPGTGLGAIKRLSATSDFYSLAGGGTVVLSIFWRNTPPPNGNQWLVGGVNIPMPGQDVCGDAWAVRARDGRIDAMMIDGLGHGPEAGKAADAAVRAFLTTNGRSPSRFLEEADAALQRTRGAAVGTAVIDARQGALTFAGVGNIAAVIVTADDSQHLVSFGGIVGERNIHIREFTSPWSADSVFIAHSDGIATRWNLSTYPGIAARHPAIIAGVLYRDFLRGRDDASILIVKPRR